MILMNTKRPPFSDRRVRQALNHAVNTDEIVTGILSGFADKPVGVVHPDMFGFTGDVEKHPYDPAKAKALLAEAVSEAASRQRWSCFSMDSGRRRWSS